MVGFKNEFVRRERSSEQEAVMKYAKNQGRKARRGRGKREEGASRKGSKDLDEDLLFNIS
jgi:hypothetical protein